jgi:monovalent cation:H+ antiporter, CPA1 family
LFPTASIIISVAALLSWANHKFTRLPSTIGVMLIALSASLILVTFGETESGCRRVLTHLVTGIDFNEAVFHGILPLLLFAGALHVDFNDLKRAWLAVSSLALAGTAASILAVAGGLYLVLSWIGLPVPWIGCLLFGALISPTDPVAVLGIMKAVKAPREIETLIAGESLFNDGVGVVAFVALVAIAAGDSLPSPAGAALLLIREAGGGMLLGAAVGAVAIGFLKSVDQYQVEILLTLAVAMGSYALAESLHTSAPIAVVTAGLFIGNQGRAFSMSAQTARRVDEFWELIDEFLNVVLFMLMGLEVLVLPLRAASLWAGAAAILVSLLARWAIVAGIASGLRSLGRPLGRGAVAILTWGGLRGGVSLALALALPAADHRDILLAAAYVVVVFSVLAQGLSVGVLVRRSSVSPPAL